MNNPDTLQQQADELEKPNFNIWSTQDLLNKEFPEATWLVDKLIPKPGLTFIAGKAGKGKSLLTLAVAKAVSHGFDLAGQFKVDECGVLIIDEENQPSEMQKRVKLFHFEEESPVYYMSMQGFKVIKSTHIKAILDIAKEKNCKTVIIDSLVRTHRLDENLSSDMKKIRESLTPLFAANLAVIIIHHQGKLGADQREVGMRGSSELDAMAESILMVSKADRILTITQTKSRQSEAIPAFEVELVGDGKESLDLIYRGLDSTNKLNIAKQAVLELLAGVTSPMNQSEICAKVGDQYDVPANKTRTALSNLVQAKEVVLTKGDHGAKLYSFWQEEI